MSRSYRKGYRPHYRTDSWYRNQYHRSFRRKAKAALKEQIFALDDENPSEKIISKGIDYGCKCSDPWSWPSDGRTCFEDDLSTLRGAFDEDVFGEPVGRWSSKNNTWEDYLKYRDAKWNAPPQKWVLRYKPYLGERLVSHVVWYTEGVPPCTHTTEWEPVYGDSVEKILDHHPYVSDVPKDAANIYFRRMNKWQYVQAKNDLNLIEFLFHRTMIPLTFKNPEEMVAWLRKNEEKILRSWFKVLYGK